MSAWIKVDLRFVSQDGEREEKVILNNAIIGGWTGRDRAAIEHHIEELVKIGVPRPETIPTYYRVGISRIVTSSAIQAIGGGSSGEVEYLLLNYKGEIWVGVGSDHTDRDAETKGITLAKQLCDKPIACTFWPYSEVSDHWDDLIVRSYVTIDGKRQLYQEGTIASMLPADVLMEGYMEGGGQLAEGNLMFGGTLAAIGGIRPGERFDFELEDPALGRKISHGYTVHSLPITG